MLSAVLCFCREERRGNTNFGGQCGNKKRGSGPQSVPVTSHLTSEGPRIHLPTRRLDLQASIAATLRTYGGLNYHAVSVVVVVHWHMNEYDLDVRSLSTTFYALGRPDSILGILKVITSKAGESMV